MMESLKRYSSVIEGLIYHYGSGMKVHLARIGRFLLVATFIEDSLRICFQWTEQHEYLIQGRGFSSLAATLFLGLIVSTMLVSSLLILVLPDGGKSSSNRFLLPSSCYGLMVVILAQAIGYGYITDPSTVFRSCSLMGGLLLVLAQASHPTTNKAAKHGFFANGGPGLLQPLDEKRGSGYFMLVGRILLICLFGSMIFAVAHDPTSLIKWVLAILALLSSSLIIVGFQVKLSALLLLSFLSITNILVNNWWSLSDGHPGRDFIKYDFFQTLSIIGGFLLLLQLGPGSLSIDEKKKEF